MDTSIFATEGAGSGVLAESIGNRLWDTKYQCMYMYIYIYICVCMYMYYNIYIYICICIHMCVYVSLFLSAHIDTWFVILQ